MKMDLISVPYKTLHVVYLYFFLENTKSRNRPVTSIGKWYTLSSAMFSPENPTTENRRVTRPFSTFLVN